MKTEKKIRKVIVEGPDCSGKSTLVERLKNSLYWDSKYLRHAGENQFFRYLKEYSHGENIVFDRSHFSEEVYSHLWRKGSPFLEEEKKMLDRICELHGLIIFSLPEKEEIKKRYLARDFDQQITLDELMESYEKFEAESKKVDCIIYRSRDYEELNELVKRITEMAK
jgi:thymidylate kinase